MLQKMNLVVLGPYCYLFIYFQKCLKALLLIASLYSLGYESISMCIWKRKIQGGSKDALSTISSEAVALSTHTQNRGEGREGGGKLRPLYKELRI